MQARFTGSSLILNITERVGEENLFSFCLVGQRALAAGWIDKEQNCDTIFLRRMEDEENFVGSIEWHCQQAVDIKR